jgi:broad specificity phosphatase PhoE
MKRILLIRHGQTDWNIEGRWQGHFDVTLNDEGRAQARTLADYLRDHPITAVYSSDLVRAHETAARVAEAHGLSVQDDPRWRELHLGVFQGLTTTEINSKYPEEMRRTREEYLDYVIPTGESRRAMQKRAYAAFREIVEREAGPEIVVVSHGGTIRVLLMRLFRENADILRRSVHNTSISTVETDGEVHRLISIAATPHLMD